MIGNIFHSLSYNFNYSIYSNKFKIFINIKKFIIKFIIYLYIMIYLLNIIISSSNISPLTFTYLKWIPI